LLTARADRTGACRVSLPGLDWPVPAPACSSRSTPSLAFPETSSLVITLLVALQAESVDAVFVQRSSTMWPVTVTTPFLCMPVYSSSRTSALAM